MTADRRRRMRARLAGAATALAVALGGPAQAYELDELARCLAVDGRLEVGYRQDRLVQSIDETLSSSGRMVYRPPDRLELIQREPQRERAVIEGGRMSVFDGDGDEVATFELAERPGLQLTFDGVRGLLAGDAQALREAFAVSLQGGRADWTMRLEPRSEAARYHLNAIEVTGGAHDGGCAVRSIDVRLRGGGRRTIHLRSGGDSG